MAKSPVKVVGGIIIMIGGLLLALLDAHMLLYNTDSLMETTKELAMLNLPSFGSVSLGNWAICYAAVVIHLGAVGFGAAYIQEMPQMGDRRMETAVPPPPPSTQQTAIRGKAKENAERSQATETTPPPHSATQKTTKAKAPTMLNKDQAKKIGITVLAALVMVFAAGRVYEFVSNMAIVAPAQQLTKDEAMEIAQTLNSYVITSKGYGNTLKNLMVASAALDQLTLYESAKKISDLQLSNWLTMVDYMHKLPDYQKENATEIEDAADSYMLSQMGAADNLCDYLRKEDIKYLSNVKNRLSTYGVKELEFREALEVFLTAHDWTAHELADSYPQLGISVDTDGTVMYEVVEPSDEAA